MFRIIPDLQKQWMVVIAIALLICQTAVGSAQTPVPNDHKTYLPLILRNYCPPETLPRINAPRFPDNSDIPANYFSQTAIAWFGQVTPSKNYAEIRAGYNNQYLYVYLAVFDRLLWYDENPRPEKLTEWDAATLLLDTSGGSSLSTGSWRFVAQLSGDESAAHRAVYRGSVSGWQATNIPVQTKPGWRGNALNDDSDSDRGWAMGFIIPFSGLGWASSTPPNGQTWRMAVILHDRDSRNGPPLADQTWPPAITVQEPACWGFLNFGLPSYQSNRPVTGSAIIRRPFENSPLVPDADVGGVIKNQCPGDEFHIWNDWGNRNYGNAPDFNIQNQSDVADWPCFSKYYITFPLTDIPDGKAIVSATLSLWQFGNSDPTGARPSWIQVLTTRQDWRENTITWNNAPLAHENVGGSWVQPLNEFPGWPGVERRWDVSYAAAKAHTLGQPLRLILYSADSDYHSGKYFVSSNTGDWNIEGRPRLEVRWGNP